MILNIIDRRSKPYKFERVNAIIEPTWHDNDCPNADKAIKTFPATWIGYAEREHISLDEAISWAHGHFDEVTLYIYDEDGGLYEAKGPKHAKAKETI